MQCQKTRDSLEGYLKWYIEPFFHLKPVRLVFLWIATISDAKAENLIDSSTLNLKLEINC